MPQPWWPEASTPWPYLLTGAPGGPVPPAVGVHVFLDKGRAADGQPQHGEGTLRGGSGDSETVWMAEGLG